MQSPFPNKPWTSFYYSLGATAASCDKGTIGVFATTLSSVGVFDTAGTVAAGGSLATDSRASQHTKILIRCSYDIKENESLPPEESPTICIVVHLRCCGRSASVGFAGTVWSAVVGVVLVIGGEDGKGLSARNPRVVRALGGLNSS